MKVLFAVYYIGELIYFHQSMQKMQEVTEIKKWLYLSASDLP